MNGGGLSTSIGRIMRLAALRGAERYLEIGVETGDTFLRVDLPVKVGVDPRFRFDTSAHRQEGVFYHPIPSNLFFSRLNKGLIDVEAGAAPGEKPVFDLIFIDGLHTFTQSYRDFVGSLPFSHDKTIWLMDDTVPCDAYSAIPSMEQSLRLRREAGAPGTPWHGDVFKTILAIHDFHPEYSYCTPVGGNPQTVVWKAAPSGRSRVFPSMETIAALNFGDLIENTDLMMPVEDGQFEGYLGQSLAPRSLIDRRNNSLMRRMGDSRGRPLAS